MRFFKDDSSTWNKIIASLPNPHLLQTWEWSQVKAKYGWEPIPLLWESEYAGHEPLAAAMALKRKVINSGFAARLCILYIPKGPLMDWGDASLRKRVLDDLQAFAKKQGAIFLKGDPDVILGTGVPGAGDEVMNDDGNIVVADLTGRGWRCSSDQIQFRNTVEIDLTIPEDEMLARMKQKTRYNVRLAGKKGVTVRAGTTDDLPLLYKMYAETSVRDGFVIRDEGYYRTVWETFTLNVERSAFNVQSSIPFAEPLIAEVDGEPVSAIFVFYFGRRAYYIYGMSRDAHREKMPAYLLQWEAMKRAREYGCKVYDLWGAPDEFDESDSMWGVYRFKEGLGGRVVRTLGAWDYAPNSLWYRMYSEIIPRVLDVMRSHGREKTRQNLSA
jgi:lipid II:glycine glycyltransferase (peptidoglycan interpeptide bridge formation enzyme)